MADQKTLTNAEKQRRWRVRRQAELERLRNENWQLRQQLEQLTSKPTAEHSERVHVNLS